MMQSIAAAHAGEQIRFSDAKHACMFASDDTMIYVITQHLSVTLCNGVSPEFWLQFGVSVCTLQWLMPFELVLLTPVFQPLSVFVPCFSS